ncbi:hypothetical protein K0M31_005010 [Melipona bicolor]|uniref:Uncharacterized protein n=1 Tax=Melipona bicolor TaxID=60889 RepID=A0AA40FVY0_9HYME|nr:hypothetical protein K0M31_005010 [Melipona bicolor]
MKRYLPTSGRKASRKDRPEKIKQLKLALMSTSVKSRIRSFEVVSLVTTTEGSEALHTARNPSARDIRRRLAP